MTIVVSGCTSPAYSTNEHHQSTDKYEHATTHTDDNLDDQSDYKQGNAEGKLELGLIQPSLYGLVHRLKLTTIIRMHTVRHHECRLGFHQRPALVFWAATSMTLPRMPAVELVPRKDINPSIPRPEGILLPPDGAALGSHRDDLPAYIEICCCLSDGQDIVLCHTSTCQLSILDAA